MANRSKKTVLSVRVSPYSKACLDALAAIRGQSLPDVIEWLLDGALMGEAVPCPPLIREKAPQLGRGERSLVLLGNLMDSIWTEDAELLKLRLYLLLPAALSERDRGVVQAILNNQEMFCGRDGLFDGVDPEFVPDDPAIPRLSLALVHLYWPLVSDYVRFLAANSLNLSLPDYVDMLRKSGELDPLYDVL